MKNFSSISNYKPLFLFFCILFIEIILEEVLNIEVDKIFLVVYFLYFFLYTFYILKKHEEAFLVLKKTVNEQHNEIIKINNILNSSSYRFDISIVPNWHEIKNMIAEQDIAKCETEIAEIKNDKELNIEDDKSLYGKLFKFSYFYNGISKMEQIWSEHSNAFVDAIEIQGNIFYSSHKTKCLSIDKYKNNKIVHKLLLENYVIRPDSIGIENYNGILLENNIFSKIPFGKIFNFLIDLDKNDCNPMKKIKSFPNNLSIEMKKYGVEYDVLKYFNPFEEYSNENDKKEVLIDLESDWAEANGIQIFNINIDRHIFTTKYYELYIKLTIFESVQE